MTILFCNVSINIHISANVISKDIFCKGFILKIKFIKLESQLNSRKIKYDQEFFKQFKYFQNLSIKKINKDMLRMEKEHKLFKRNSEEYSLHFNKSFA